MKEELAKIAWEIANSDQVKPLIAGALKKGFLAVKSLVMTHPYVAVGVISAALIANYIIENWDEISDSTFDDSDSSEYNGPATDFDDPIFWIIRDS